MSIATVIENPIYQGLHSPDCKKALDKTSLKVFDAIKEINVFEEKLYIWSFYKVKDSHVVIQKTALTGVTALGFVLKITECVAVVGLGVLHILIPSYYCLTNERQTLRNTVQYFHTSLNTIFGGGVAQSVVYTIKTLLQIGSITFYTHESAKPLNDFSNSSWNWRTRLPQVLPDFSTERPVLPIAPHCKKMFDNLDFLEGEISENITIFSPLLYENTRIYLKNQQEMVIRFAMVPITLVDFTLETTKHLVRSINCLVKTILPFPYLLGREQSLPGAIENMHHLALSLQVLGNIPVLALRAIYQIGGALRYGQIHAKPLIFNA